MTEPLDVPYRERERSVTMEPMGEHDELLTINIGPHHPATHGVLRLLTTLEGEIVRDVKPIVGYVHTGIEKSCEDQQYWKVIPFVERMDYLVLLLQRDGVLHGGGEPAWTRRCRPARSGCA